MTWPSLSTTRPWLSIFKPAEGEGDAAGDGIGFEWAFVDRCGLSSISERARPFGAAAVLDVRIEWHVLHHGGIIGLDGGERAFGRIS